MSVTEFTITPPDYVAGNWIPYEERTDEGKRLTDEYHEEIGLFSDQPYMPGELPERVLDYEAEKKVTGSLMPRPWQLTGSCVGYSWWRAFCNATVGDILYRGDVEAVHLPFVLATYGVGRQLAGMRGRGEGSFGSAQARAGQEFGALPIDYGGLPEVQFDGNWMHYTKSIELQWSHPTGWPIPIDKLREEAKKHNIGTATRIKSIEELLQAKAQGYGVTVASSFGTRGAKVVDDVLIAERNSSWAHQMSVAGFWKHPRAGLIFPWDNQWKDTMGRCPTLEPLGVNGSFWVREADMEWAIRTGEVYAHTATGGFELREIDWQNLGVTYEN